MDSKADETFALVLKDNKKAEYIWLDKNFKTKSKVSLSLEHSILDKSKYQYVGGSSNNDLYHFVFRYPDKDIFTMETVDFTAKTTKDEVILDLTKDEKFVKSFSYYNNFYVIAANDKTSQLIICVLNGNGELSTKKLDFKVPAAAGKTKLHEYVAGLKTLRDDAEPDFSDATEHKKLFCSEHELKMVIDGVGEATHIYTLQLPSLTANEQFISYSSQLEQGEKEKEVVINSFICNNILYSMIKGKKNIKIGLWDLDKGGTLLTNYVISEEQDNYKLFATQPTSVSRSGSEVKEEGVDGVKKLMKQLSFGNMGVMVYKLPAGKILVTAGTYHTVVLASGGGMSYSGGFQQSRTSAGVAIPGAVEYNAFKYTRPGNSTYISEDARHYYSTYFQYTLDPVTLRPSKQKVPVSLPEQVKDYIGTVNSKVKATNQFAIGKNQYYGYYDVDTKSYIVEQIIIR